MPSYVQDLFEKRLQGRGLHLHELAVLAATVEHLVHNEALSKLGAVGETALQLSQSGSYAGEWEPNTTVGTWPATGEKNNSSPRGHQMKKKQCYAKLNPSGPK